MVVGHHLVWSVYGWWLPNDPRGSTSRVVRVPALAELGEAYYGRKPKQPLRQELREFHREAAQVLAHSVLVFSPEEIELVAANFAETIRRCRYTCYACAIMPDHVHMLIRKHRDKAEQMMEVFQEDSRTALIAAGRRPGNHPVWGGPGWKVFQFSREDMARIVRYIAKNPGERRMAPQQWEFVTPYDGWLPAGARRAPGG